MIEVFLNSLVRVVLLVALAVPGFVLQKLKKLPIATLSVLSAIVIYISQPALALYSFLEAEYKSELLFNMGVALVVSFIFNIGLFLISHLIFKKFKPENEAQICTMASALSNCGFFGIPLIQVLFNNPIITVYALIYMIAFNIVLWTFGVWVLTGKKEYVSLKKAFLNLPTIVLVVALPLFFMNLHLATSDNVVISSLMRYFKYFSDFNAPFTMMMMGIRLADMKISSVFSDKKVYVVSVLKLIVFPLLSLAFMLLLRLVPFIAMDDAMVVSLIVCVAMPSATMTISFAENFNGNKDMAVKTVLQTTVFCLITVPLIVTLMSTLGLIAL